MERLTTTSGLRICPTWDAQCIKSNDKAGGDKMDTDIIFWILIVLTGMVTFNLWLSFLTIKQFFKQKTPPNYAKKPQPPKEPSPKELLEAWRREHNPKAQQSDDDKISLKKPIRGRPKKGKKEAPNLELGEDTRLV